MMENITSHLIRYINETGMARFEVGPDPDTGLPVAGVMFLDENQFIPLYDLALNHELGFYTRSQFPHVDPVAVYEPEYEVCPAVSSDGWQHYVLMDNDGFGYLLGEWHQVVEAYHALRRVVELGQPLGEELPEDWNLLHQWCSTAEAVAICVAFAPDEYAPAQTPDRLRAAARSGRLQAHQTPSGRWLYNRQSLDRWLRDPDAHAVGRPRK